MSSLFAALGVAISGLNAQSQSIGNISDNLSNSETTGYKSIGTSFENLVTASSATDNSPGGVRASPMYQNDVQGNIASTSTTTNLAISGQGYFQVTSATQDANGNTQFSGNHYYTRQGDFTLNKDGYMVNSSGYYLEGYAISSSGIVDTADTTQIQISSLLDNPVSTAKITYAANLPASATTTYTSSASTVNVYDALGNTHQTSVVWHNTGVNTWQATVTVANGGGSTDDYKAVFDVTFNNSSNIGTINDITGVSAGYYNSTTGALTTALSAPATSTATAGSSADVTLSGLAFSGAGAQSIDLNLGIYDSSSGVTQYANSSNTVSVSTITQDGLGAGSYSSLGIDNNGVVSINYTNGSTRKIYQVPIAQFNSPDNLQRSSGGVYTATLTSGQANLHLAGSNGAGTVSSSSLESSNVDIATEFTTMIKSQQVYSANAKVVTAVNDMLKTIIQTV